MANFDAILAGLHDNSEVSDDASQAIEITKKRAFVVPADYDLVLGYVGDVNSQVVTFRLPYSHEAHCLHKCAHKVVKWKNLKSGAEGESELTPVTDTAAEPSWEGTWAVPPEAMTGAGTVEVSFSLYDVADGENADEVLIAFSWNTPTFSGFSVGEGFGDVGDIWEQGGWLPAKNEILNVNVDNRTIVEPPKFNTIVANYGDVGTSKVFFTIDKYVRGMDILSSQTHVCINYSLGGVITQGTDKIENDISHKRIYKTDSKSKSEKVLLIWDIPSNITLNTEGYVGPITISIELFQVAEDKITKRWVSSNYSRLTIGQSLLQTDAISVVQRNEQIVRELVGTEIDNYMDNTYFVTDTNIADPNDYKDNN